MRDVVAIIPAAGSGRRMGQKINKQFLEIQGRTILERTLQAFQSAKKISRIIVVARPEDQPAVRDIVKQAELWKVSDIVSGGAERQDSIYEGLKLTRHTDGWVLVHDGARPFVSAQEIDSFVEALILRKALIMAVPAKDTIKRVVDGVVVETLERAQLWNIQTPQGFERDALVSAYEAARSEGFSGTDDASVMEWFGYKVNVHEGSYENIKVTTPDDIYVGEAILKMKGERQDAHRHRV